MGLGNGYMIATIPERESRGLKVASARSPFSKVIQMTILGSRDFDETGFDCQGHAVFGPDFEATENGFADVFNGFVLGRSLADATGDGGTFGDPDAVFVAFEGNHGFYEGSFRCLWPAGKVISGGLCGPHIPSGRVSGRAKDWKRRGIVPQKSENGAGKIAEAKQKFPVRFIRMNERSMHTF